MVCALMASLPTATPVQGQVTDMFRVVGLASGLVDPMQIAVARDGRVFIAERQGRIRVYDPAAKATVSAGSIGVSFPKEDGLIGMVLDPAFPAKRRLFLLYTPKESPDSLRLSRFSLSVEGRLDIASRKDLLRIPYRHNEHSSGGLAFDGKGNLYLGIGDDSNNHADGFPPMDETAGRSDWDAQKSAANSNDLRGKILRIHPEEDGSYSIPAGNLFPKGLAGTRPEIYTMGNRNPFRLTVDARTDWLYWAEPGPNARVEDPLRGPRGHEEVNLAKAPGNFGWPYCIAANRCYRDYDYATKASGATFNPSALRNDSPNNTGKAELPQAQAALLWYSYTNPDGFPVFGSGSAEAAMTGPVYRYDQGLDSPIKLPRDFDACLFLLDWGRGFIHYARLDPEGRPVSVLRFREGPSVKGPMDMKVGPDGALYLLNWGSASYPHSSEGTLSRLEYTGPQEPVSLARPAPGLRSRQDRLVLPGALVELPEGADFLAAYDMGGARVWSHRLRRAGGTERVRIPLEAAGPVRLRFSR